jgi:hypothetical protein
MPRDPNDDVRRRYEKELGVELGSIFAELWQELTSLHLFWNEYEAIFATSHEHLAIANKAAGGFFYILQKLMWEAILLHLARLTDPAQSPGGKQNLSVTALVSLVKPEIREELRGLVDKVKSDTAFARDWRNRYVAHSDRLLALGNSAARPLAPASRLAVKQALNSLDEVLNLVDKSYLDSTTMFGFVKPLRGANALISVLGRGLKGQEQDERQK